MPITVQPKNTAITRITQYNSEGGYAPPRWGCYWQYDLPDGKTYKLYSTIDGLKLNGGVPIEPSPQFTVTFAMGSPFPVILAE